MNRKKIWLTGARGFVGSALIEVLRDSGADMTFFTQYRNIKNDFQEKDCLIYLNYLDVLDIEEKINHFGLPDIFIHLGWGGMTDPESSIHIEENVQIGKNLIEIFFKRGLKKFIFIGSVNQYGSRKGCLSEDMEPQGRLTNYAKGKNEVEQFGLQTAEKANNIFISVRVFYVFGAGQRPGSLINDLFDARRNGMNVSLSSCEHYRDYIYVFDVAEGLRRICDIKKSTVINLGSGKVIQVKDFVINFWNELECDSSQLKFGVRTLRPGEPEQPKSYADLTRLVTLTQWQPKFSVQEGILKTIESLCHE